MIGPLLAAVFSLSAQGGGPEVHGVGLYEGREGTGDAMHGPLADILIDRPGRDVVLTLCSYEPLRWRIAATPGTEVEQIVLHGHAEQSEVTLNGKRLGDAAASERLPCYYETQGGRFRDYVRAVGETYGEDALASAVGSYRAPEAPFVLSAAPGVLTHPALRADPLADLPKLDRLPVGLSWAVRGPSDGRALRREKDTIIVDGPDGPVSYAPTLDVPRVSWPVGAAMDRSGDRAFLVTLGGEGFLYEIDLASGEWSIAASMQGRDVGGIRYDEKRETVWAADKRSDVIELVAMSGEGITVTEVPLARFVGFLDLYGTAAPEFDVIAASDAQLLVRTTGRHGAEPEAGTITYLVEADEGTVDLVSYELAD